MCKRELDHAVRPGRHFLVKAGRNVIRDWEGASNYCRITELRRKILFDRGAVASQSPDNKIMRPHTCLIGKYCSTWKVSVKVPRTLTGKFLVCVTSSEKQAARTFQHVRHIAEDLLCYVRCPSLCGRNFLIVTLIFEEADIPSLPRTQTLQHYFPVTREIRRGIRESHCYAVRRFNYIFEIGFGNKAHIFFTNSICIRELTHTSRKIQYHL